MGVDVIFDRGTIAFRLGASGPQNGFVGPLMKAPINHNLACFYLGSIKNTDIYCHLMRFVIFRYGYMGERLLLANPRSLEMEWGMRGRGCL